MPFYLYPMSNVKQQVKFHNTVTSNTTRMNCPESIRHAVFVCSATLHFKKTHKKTTTIRKTKPTINTLDCNSWELKRTHNMGLSSFY